MKLPFKNTLYSIFIIIAITTIVHIYVCLFFKLPFE